MTPVNNSVPADAGASNVSDAAQALTTAAKGVVVSSAAAVKTAVAAPPARNTASAKTTQASTKLVNNLQDINFASIAIIVAMTWGAIWLIRRTLPYLAQRGPTQLRLYLLGAVPIARVALLTFAILWIIPLIFNITFQNFLVIAGAASVAIGFAFKDYVSSLIAGIVAIVERPYRPGDWVTIDDNYGEVRNVGLRAIQIVTAGDNVVTVPHEKIWTDSIVNANDGARTLQCAIDFYVAPGHDAARIRTALLDVGRTSAYVSYAHDVRVVLAQTQWGTRYKLRAYPFDLRDQFAFGTDLTARGMAAIESAGGTLIIAPAAVTLKD